MDTQFRQLLILTTSISAVTTASGSGRWVCSGPSSQLTYNQCQSLGSDGDGCFYMPHFAEYRPCSTICDNVKAFSIDDERCNAFCSDYLRTNCQLETVESVSSSSLEHLPSSTAASLSSTVSSEREELSAALIITACIGLLVLVSATIIIMVLLVMKSRRRRVKRQRPLSKGCHSIQESVAHYQDVSSSSVLSQPFVPSCTVVQTSDGGYEKTEVTQNSANESKQQADWI